MPERTAIAPNPSSPRKVSKPEDCHLGLMVVELGPAIEWPGPPVREPWKLSQRDFLKTCFRSKSILLFP